MSITEKKFSFRLDEVPHFVVQYRPKPKGPRLTTFHAEKEMDSYGSESHEMKAYAKGFTDGVVWMQKRMRDVNNRNIGKLVLKHLKGKHESRDSGRDSDVESR